MKIAIPTYYYPGCADWSKALSDSSTKYVIINPNSGSGTKIDPNYVNQTKEAQSLQINVLGYVHTSYGKRPIEEVKADIDRYYDWYHVSGIFLDEAPTSDSPSSLVLYMKSLYDHIKAKSTNDAVILNPGTNSSSAYYLYAVIFFKFSEGGDSLF
eukprot:TRINITY_DN3565_c0_g1_i1.p1 TRINITY_DN3565_c0_g1~~TRINITY_DN3565_c0_g1_i1.p1  ORF type:complete len:155 (+),score=33.10 TRINITY_DN3565_c0_g1_i1:222-686(+)